MASVKTMTRDDADLAFKELTRELATGSPASLLDYADQLASLAKSGHRMHGAFRPWSSRNMALLESQRRRLDESWHGLLAGRAAWSRMEREVLPTATPKFIWVPSIKSVDDPANTGEKKKVVRGFVKSEVFDWSDTASLDPDGFEPDWTIPLATGDEATLDALVASSPVPVEFVDMASRPENGYYDGSRIVVNAAASYSVGNQISTLVHELIHCELDHPAMIAASDDEAAAIAESEQEAALGQYLAMKMLGLDEEVGNDVTVAAAAYLHSWTDPGTKEPIEGHKRRMKLLTARLDTALGAANSVIEKLLA